MPRSLFLGAPCWRPPAPTRQSKVWNAETLSLVRTYRGHSGAVLALDASADGRTLASGADDGQIRLWSTASTRQIRSMRAHGGSITSLAFSPGGDLLASASEDGGVKVWDAKRGKLASHCRSGRVVFALSRSCRMGGA